MLIFPEGTRTHDGEVAPLKPGFIAVARRSRVPLVPVGLDGAYQAWPRTSRLPRPSRLAVVDRPADRARRSGRDERRGPAGGAGAADPDVS